MGSVSDLGLSALIFSPQAARVSAKGIIGTSKKLRIDFMVNIFN
jgi:hypothetical protein